jgi:AcrR family transcriptional regulator
MSTRTTQSRILQTALDLFNERGTAAVSANRIAEHCGVSKGNLGYHYHNKREIIHAIFQNAVQEMDSGWYRDHLTPTLEHMAAMFVRQLRLIVKYRFFYRELTDLLRQDPSLRNLFTRNRERRFRELERFMHALSGQGIMNLPTDARRLRSLINVTWIVTEQWLNYMDYLDYQDQPASVEAILDGYRAILEVLRPYLCNDFQRIMGESVLIIEHLATQSTPDRDILLSA